MVVAQVVGSYGDGGIAHPLAGRPMLGHLVAACESAGFSRIVVVTGPDNRSVLKGMAVPAGLPQDIAWARRWEAPDGSRHFIAQAPLRGEAGEAPLLGWRVVVLQDEDAALTIVDQLSNSMLRVGLLAAVLLAAAGIWMSRRMLTPWGPVFEAVLAHERLGDHAGVASPPSSSPAAA